MYVVYCTSIRTFKYISPIEILQKLIEFYQHLDVKYSTMAMAIAIVTYGNG